MMRAVREAKSRAVRKGLPFNKNRNNVMIPRIYQKVGTRFLTSRTGAILGDKVGTGKTATTIWAVIEVQACHVLVIVPSNLKRQWSNEIAQVEPYPTTYDESTQTVTVYGPTVRVYQLAHYEQFTKQGINKKHNWLSKTWDVLIVDEAHKVKNKNAQRSKNIAVLQARYYWLLTGTPLAEFPQDCWHLLHIVARDKFSDNKPGAQSQTRFEGTYCITENGKVSGIRYVKHEGRWSKEPVLRMLREQLAPYLLARNLDDVGLELPPLTVTDVHLEMNPDQAAFYQEVQRQVVIDLTAGNVTPDSDNQLVITEAGARFTRLHQCASAASTFKPGISNTKLDWLTDYIEGGGEPAVILTRYRHTVTVIEAELKRLGATGFIVGTHASLSTGHNLQHLHVMILWDLDYSRLVYEQGLGRCHRSGQTKPVQVYRLLASGTIDFRVRDLIDRKQTNIQMIIEWLRGLNDVKK